MPLTKRDRGSGASADLALTIEDRWVPKESEPTVTKKKMRGLALDEEVDPRARRGPRPIVRGCRGARARAGSPRDPRAPTAGTRRGSRPLVRGCRKADARVHAGSPRDPRVPAPTTRRLRACARLGPVPLPSQPRSRAGRRSGRTREIFQWRGDAGCGPGLPGWTDADKTHLGEEMADVLLYLVRMADRCGVDLGAAAEAKLEKNARKYPADRARGSSAKYTAYQR